MNLVQIGYYYDYWLTHLEKQMSFLMDRSFTFESLLTRIYAIGQAHLLLELNDEL